MIGLNFFNMPQVMPLVFVFFFSSRRRHTRYWRDWSSDVCSSDLEQPEVGLLQPDAACLQKEHGVNGVSTLGVAQGQLERAGHLRTGDLTDAAPLKEPLDGEHDRSLAVELAACYH